MGSSIRAIVDINKRANDFSSSIVLVLGPDHDAKSILGLSMTLYRNQTYLLYVYGPDQMEAKAAMREVFAKHHLQLQLKEDP
ncbi:HPr family phosphocarrier protein [Paenibacillus sp. ISL-20]|uniref:HPr family phosphocarrier protein n=1 Tax=Paenibacillus sp. ISL-20 TaxID=2819163 RepID=UPI001BE89E75|nr:HPr family phosphocarrier protein [Paenibacillus sp. ISL-20]MBT2761136.1 HPr family phosphocarrier protein [Paenibacillus sp. ISL-20]